jgi:hypothetical protein
MDSNKNQRENDKNQNSNEGASENRLNNKWV